MLSASPHYRGQVGTAALPSPEPLCSSTESQWLFVPHLSPSRKCHRCSWQMPQSWLRRGLLDIPLRDVCLQHDRGHGTDAISHHTHQVGPLPGGTDELDGAALGVVAGLEEPWSSTGSCREPRVPHSSWLLPFRLSPDP